MVLVGMLFGVLFGVLVGVSFGVVFGVFVCVLVVVFVATLSQYTSVPFRAVVLVVQHCIAGNDNDCAELPRTCTVSRAVGWTGTKLATVTLNTDSCRKGQ